jgi:peptidoglycan/LPS O-acetylase OafA/YrhL
MRQRLAFYSIFGESFHAAHCKHFWRTRVKPAIANVPGTSVSGSPTWLVRLSAPFQELVEPPKGQNPALDVLRSLAILMVIACHTLTPTKAAGLPENLFTRFPLVRGGWTGVDLFFVLSGYLIGRQLWRELQRTQKIDVGRFMIRRGLRIWPLYYAVLAFTVLVVEAGRFGFGDWWPDALFLSNYIGPQVVHGGWSLCVEEQFYLLAPVLLLISRNWVPSVKSYRKILVGMFLLLPFIRAFAWWRLTQQHVSPDKSLIDQALYFPFHTHSDGLVVGLLLSNLEATNSLARGRGILGKAWVVVIGFALCALCYAASARFLNYTGLGLAFGSLVCFALPRTESLPAVVRARPFYVLSRLSYGMYLNHQWITWPVFRALRSGGTVLESHPLVFNTLFFLILALCSTIAACVTFSLIEWPFLRLRTRLLEGRVAPRNDVQTIPVQ